MEKRMLENFDKYQIHATQRTKNVLTVNPELSVYVRRRPVEALRAIDANGDWVFGIELRQINTLTLAKLRALAPDGTNVSVTSVSMAQWPQTMEVRHSAIELSDSGAGLVSISFDDRYELELETQASKIVELRTFYPDGVEMLAPWVTYALTA
jgi:hypothetical protein